MPLFYFSGCLIKVQWTCRLALTGGYHNIIFELNTITLFLIFRCKIINGSLCAEEHAMGDVKTWDLLSILQVNSRKDISSYY